MTQGEEGRPYSNLFEEKTQHPGVGLVVESVKKDESRYIYPEMVGESG